MPQDMIEISVEHQLSRLHVLLGDEERLDALFQAFEEADVDAHGSLKTASELAAVLHEFLSSKDRERLNMEQLAARFSTRNHRFDYPAFCKALRSPPLLASETRCRRPHSPTRKAKALSPSKQQQYDHPTMRVDQRLESQRLLTESVRLKILRGVQGDSAETQAGFLGVQDALYRLDVKGDGYLDARVFLKKFLGRLKSPLTRPERDFLLEKLRAQSKEEGGRNLIDYEQLGHVCNLDSDVSLSEVDSDPDQDEAQSPPKTSQLGAGFLAAEKRLHEFLRTPVLITGVNRDNEDSTTSDTPRSVFTGAEKFLEVAEAMDPQNTGFLHENDFSRILTKCGVETPPTLLREMLSRFTRSPDGLLSYSKFLQRYGQNPQCSRERRELKRLILQLLHQAKVPTAEWLQFLRKRFERYDVKEHGVEQGCVSSETFLRIVQGRSKVVKLTVDEAAQLTSLFLRNSKNSSPARVQYLEFLRFVEESHQSLRVKLPVSLSITTAKTTPSDLPKRQPASPSRSKSGDLSLSPPSTDSAVESVGDYLMYHATPLERQNFEDLMEVLHAFQEGRETAEVDGRASKDQVVRPVANGVVLPLGEKLRVQIQFLL